MTYRKTLLRSVANICIYTQSENSHNVATPSNHSLWGSIYGVAKSTNYTRGNAYDVSNEV